MILTRAVQTALLILCLFVLTPLTVIAQTQQVPGAAPPNQSAPAGSAKSVQPVGVSRSSAAKRAL